MKAMILAAGKGTRMLPLTKDTPKPLLYAGKKRLIEHHLSHLKALNITDIIINTAYLGEKIQNTLGDGDRYHVNIHYSDEGSEPLETGAGIAKALPYLGNEPFLIINADIYSDYLQLPQQQQHLNHIANTLHPESALAHLILVNNPAQHPNGDFGLDQHRLSNQSQPRYTYSGIGIYHPDFWRYAPNSDSYALGPMLRQAINDAKINGEHHTGQWADIGTPERLQQLNEQLST